MKHYGNDIPAVFVMKDVIDLHSSGVVIKNYAANILSIIIH